MTPDEIKAARERCESFDLFNAWGMRLFEFARDMKTDLPAALDHIEVQAAEIERLRETVQESRLKLASYDAGAEKLVEEVVRLRGMLDRAMELIQSPDVMILGEAWSPNYKKQAEFRASLEYDYAAMKEDK